MKGQVISVRMGTPVDNILLAELGKRSFYDLFAKDNTPEDMAAYLEASFSPDIQAEKLADPNITFLIAEIDQRPAGYSQLHLGSSSPEIEGIRPLEIVRIYSDKLWIGRGVGPALMSASINFAEQKGCDIVWLGVWQKNPRAIAFYQKWGFNIVGTQTFQLGSDLQHDFVMSRKVQMA